MNFAQQRGFRKSMSWLHTWTGLLLGWLLFAVFVTGTLAFFRQEITVWMQPEVHVARDDGHGLGRALIYLDDHAADAKRWTIALPGPRSALIDLSWGSGGRPKGDQHALMDPATGNIIEPRQTAGGKFLTDFHYQLYGVDHGLGEWIVGVAAMFMFVALVTGVIVHRNIFKDFFTFRPGKGKRSWLDAHNLTGVVALPFYLVITFSGLLLLGSDLLPAVDFVAYRGSAQGMHADLHRGKPVTPQHATRGEATTMTDLAALVAVAERQWPNNGVGSIIITNPGATKAVIELRESAGERLANRGMPERLLFDGVSGRPLAIPAQQPSPVPTLFNSLQALHIGYFALPLVRWLLFACGLLGCFVIASGLVIWPLTRQKESERLGRQPLGHRLVEILNVAAIAGLLLAVAAFFWSNRLLPSAMPGRSAAEIRVFFIVWTIAVAHAALQKHRAAWVAQLGLAGLLASLLPLLNAATGGIALPHSVAAGQLQVAAFDLCALLLGGLLMYTATQVSAYVPRHRSAPVPKRTDLCADNGQRPVEEQP